MASSRTINAPGIEMHEIDRSAYGKVDNSLQNAPVCLIAGFSAKGQNYIPTWIDSKTTFQEQFGYPTNEPEKYLYNGVVEILNNGGVCIASRLPYDNYSLDKMNYVEYKLEPGKILPSVDIESNYETVNACHDTLQNILDALSLSYDTTSLAKMKQVANKLLSKYSDECYNGSYIKNIGDFEKLDTVIATINNLSSNYRYLLMNDFGLSSYLDITYKESGSSSIDEYDRYLTRSSTANQNTIRIYDITQHEYNVFDSCDGCVKTEKEGNTNDCLGIVPVIVTPVNALYFQHLLDYTGLSNVNYSVLNNAGSFSSKYANGTKHSINTVSTDFSSIDDYMYIPLKSTQDDILCTDGTEEESISKKSTSLFPSIQYTSTGTFDRTYLKHVGIVVFKAFKDVLNNNTLSFQLLESFVGSIDRTAKNADGSTNFIDNIVNSNSQYIRMFSNVNQLYVQNSSIIATSCNKIVSLGFYKAESAKNISYSTSIMGGLTTILEKASNPNTLPLDIVIDGGVSNIAEFVHQSIETSIDLEENPALSQCNISLNSRNDTLYWRAVIKKFDDFVKYTRKDCIFLADGLRAFCLEGDYKIVRNSKYSSSIADSILPKLRYMSNVINSSYSAGYCDWFYQVDDYSGDYIWIPPSIKIAGICIKCDTYYHAWDAPAGLNRGVLSDVDDCAFSPTIDEAGKIYVNQWNYAINYPLNGIVVEGQKTFQTTPTALDRLNVRRLLLYLEKQVASIAKYFLYEGNTAYLRQKFVDTIRPVFEDCVNGNGLIDYAILCDDTINTPEVIDRNELICRIAVKPVKTLEFIRIDMICTNQSANVSEEVLK